MKISRFQVQWNGKRTKNRWWRLLDMPIALIAIFVLTSILLIASYNPPTSQTSQQGSQSQSTSGLATLAAPLENLTSRVTQDPPPPPATATPTDADPCGNKEGSEYTKCIQDVLKQCGDNTDCPGLPPACRNVPPVQFQECMEGVTGQSTYTKGDSKIQNPIAKGSSLFFFSPFEITIANSQVDLVWKALLGIVDIFLVLVILLQGLRIIFVGSIFRYARAIEDLPGALLALIVAHISLTFMLSVIGLSNSMIKYIYDFAETNPAIHRESSGIGSGKNKTDFTLRVFFPSMSSNQKESYEKTTPPGPPDAAKNWPGPKHIGDGPGTTNEDMDKFTKQYKNNTSDAICTWEKTSFDTDDREKIFGKSANVTDAPVYINIKGFSETIIKNSDQSKIPHDTLTYLQDMPQNMLDALNHFGDDDMKWYYLLGQYYDDMSKYTNKSDFFPPGQYESVRGWRDDTGSVISAATGLFSNDRITYKCSADATGDSFQLVPDDLNFTDLFKNLQNLTDALPMMRRVLALMLLAQMIIRIFFINLYVVTAPLGISCWALPGRVGQPVTRLWMQGFLSTILVQFVMVVALIGTQVLLGNILNFTAGGDPSHIAGGLDSKTISELLTIACIWFIMRIPALLDTAPMRTMAAAGQMMGQVVGTTVSMQIAHAQMVVQEVVGVASTAISIFAR